MPNAIAKPFFFRAARVTGKMPKNEVELGYEEVKFLEEVQANHGRIVIDRKSDLEKAERASTLAHLGCLRLEYRNRDQPSEEHYVLTPKADTEIRKYWRKQGILFLKVPTLPIVSSEVGSNDRQTILNSAAAHRRLSPTARQGKRCLLPFAGGD